MLNMASKNVGPGFFLLFSALFLLCCREVSSPVAVHYRGALRNFMHEQDLRAKVDLDTLQGRPNLYALGAREDLQGEILIWGGQPLVSLVRDSQLVIDTSWAHRASLLVWSQVDRWEVMEIPSEVETYAALEDYIAGRIKYFGFTADSPLPFRLWGRAAALDWHVIDWPPADSVHTHEKHRTSGPHGRLENEEVEVLGFYSTQHTGIFTHHSTNMHLHFRTEDQQLAGHVDDLRPGRMSLFLPVNPAALIERE